MKCNWLFLIFIFFFSIAKAQLYGGEITYEKISDLTFHFKLSLYSHGFAVNQWNSFIIYFSDGTQETIIKTDQIPLDSFNNSWKADFEGNHAFSDTGVYVIFFSFPNRPPDFININAGNSVNELFYIEDSLFIHDPDLFPFDYSPSYLHYQTDIGFDGVTLTHNSAIMDSDADSITYEIITPLKASNIPVQNYIWPNLISGTLPGQTFYVDSTGLVKWQTPAFYGSYCFAIKATLWKYGMKMGTIIRDMTVEFNALT